MNSVMRFLPALALPFAGALLVLAQAQSVPSLPADVSVEANIQYSPYKETVLDIMQPSGASRERRPGVVVIHGGDWMGGAKEDVVGSICRRYLEKGFVVANIEYRQADVAAAPGAGIDALAATRWFARNASKYRVDNDRIVVTGVSAGGHLALMVGMAPGEARLGPSTDVAAVVNLYGYVDLVELLSSPDPPEGLSAWIPVQDERMELAERLSPISHVRRGLPPVFSAHGEADPIVPYEQAARLTRMLREADVDARMMSVLEGGHGFSQEEQDEIYEEIFLFLKMQDILR